MMNTNAIVKHEPMNLDDITRTAKLLAMSGYFEAKGNSDTAIAQIATKILAGAELGYGPFAAVNGLHIIQGKPTISANLMAAAVKGHQKYDYRVRQMDDTSVSLEFFEGNKSLGTSTFTIEDARKAGTQNLQKFPRNMLFARAMSNGVRWFCPDVFSGNAVYTPEEFDVDANTEPVQTLRVVDTETGEIIECQPTTTNGDSRQAPEPTPQHRAARKPAVTPATQQAPQKAPQKAPSTGDELSKKFHQQITNVFNGKNLDDARHWYIEGFTSGACKSTGDLSPQTMTEMIDDLRKNTIAIRQEFITWQDAQVEAITVTVTDAEPLPA